MQETFQRIRNHRIVQGLHFYSFGLLKRLYLWVLSWAESKYGTAALAFLAFIEAWLFPIPPDVLQLALSLGRPKRSFWYAFVAVCFSVAGGIFGYFIGTFLFDTVGWPLIIALGYQEHFFIVGELFKENAFLAIAASAITPLPYKVFTIGAGFWGIGLPVLIFASAVGRGIRFFFLAVLTYFFGRQVRSIIEQYFSWLMVAVFVLMLLGYAAVKYLM